MAPPLHPYFSISQHLSSTFVRIPCSRQTTATTQILCIPPSPQSRTTPCSLHPSPSHSLLRASTTCTPSDSFHYPCDLLMASTTTGPPLGYLHHPSALPVASTGKRPSPSTLHVCPRSTIHTPSLPGSTTWVPSPGSLHRSVLFSAVSTARCVLYPVASTAHSLHRILWSTFGPFTPPSLINETMFVLYGTLFAF